MPTRLLALVIVSFAAAAFAAAADDPPAANNKYKIDIKADLSMKAAGKTENIVATTSFGYSWKREGKEKTLSMQGMSIVTTIGGREMMNMKMSAEGMFGKQQGEELNVKAADAPDELKTMLNDLFTAPLAKLEMDVNGKEVKRTIVAKPGAKIAIDNGIVANATLFHPPYFDDKDEWEADAAISAGQGNATGKLTYKKIAGGKGGQAVKVTGTLTADGIKAEGGTTIKDSKYIYSGTLIYDTKLKEWVSGVSDIEVSFSMVVGDMEIATAKGKMKLTFDQVANK